MLYSFLNKSFLFLENVIWPFIKKNWKNILIIAGVIFAILSIRSCNEKDQLIKDAQAVSQYHDSAYNSLINTWKDKYNVMHQTAVDVAVDRALVKKDLDSAAKLLKIKSSDITAISKAGFRANINQKIKVDTSYATVVKIDTATGDIDTTEKKIQKLKFSWSDKWVDVSGIIGNGEDSIHITGTDTLSRTDYTKRTWLLGPTKHFVDFSNKNPHVTLVGYKGIELHNDIKRWTIGPAIMLGYPLNQPIKVTAPVVSFGVSIQYSLIRF